jgi:RNA polymerase sigma-70 factor, ECF subfamily
MAPDESGRTASTDRRDGELVTALREERDVMAFEVLMKRYQKPIYGFILRQVRDRPRAEDLFQETFLRVYDRIETCEKPDSFKPWAFAIAANLCRNEARQRSSRPETPAGQALEGTAAAGAVGADPERAASDRELRSKIEHALGELTEEQREVFLLYQYSRLSYEEIAQAIEAPIGTVKSRMNAALVKLRNLLADLKEARA